MQLAVSILEAKLIKMGRADVMLMLVLSVFFFFSTCCFASLGRVGFTTLPLVHLQRNPNQHSKMEQFVSIQGGGSSGGHVGGTGGDGNGGSGSGSYPNSQGGGAGVTPAYGAGGGANIHRNNHHRGGSSVLSCRWKNTAIAAILSAYLLRDMYLFVQ